MKRTGTANAPLHGGHCPPWLFDHMKTLSGAIIEAIIIEYGTKEVLRRFADPVWFQSFGSVLGFDWHSSGLTTVVLGAFKEAWNQRSGEYGLFVAGGKGKASRRTPEEIDQAGSDHGLSLDCKRLVYSSRLAAKVDSGLVQDGYQLYHHVFLFDKDGAWTVVQQGMHQSEPVARRYHWLSLTLDRFTETPHQGIAGQPEPHVLDLTAKPNLPVQQASVELAQRPQDALLALRTLVESQDGARHLTMPEYHNVPRPGYFNKILYKIYDAQPQDYEALTALPGVGASTLRALAMVSEVVYGTPLAFQDPVRYAFAHGGKDGTPFPVRRPDYEATIASLERAIQTARLGDLDKMKAFRRLSHAAGT
ncbi:DUF763 domain-containing protein [Sulfobacillus harzensis]|uniref:DUF763 domain-containing protein n=1 Tax=Sulfobacillus harzensis TaxID=2729629 RepID=A0A7Y0Q3P4_9FIRM|nr:DUF763 domain-containing protein [Sulfobacillus harzensis]NMP23206.1 DUF763 domain-containing protein [Sulfobacillus harzensis]